jgi:cell division protein FtsX
MAAQALKIEPVANADASWVKTLYGIWNEAGQVAEHLAHDIEREDDADWVMEKQLEIASRVASVEATDLQDIALKLKLWAKANLPEHDPENPYNSIVISALADLQRYCAKRVERLEQGEAEE